MPFRSGFVSIVGLPNAGKSTLLNAMVGEKVSIVTHKPQTTRHRIQGIVNLDARKGRPAGQIIFLDTPGVHQPKDALGKKMMQEVNEALAHRDLVLLMVDAARRSKTDEERYVLETATAAGGSVFLLLNKVDLIDKSKLLPIIERYSQLHTFKEILPVSATKGEGLDLLLDKIIAVLPIGPRYFPKDQITDQPERFLVSELIREKVLIFTGEEIPYASSVVVEKFAETATITRIDATIFCEREGQKAILIGKGGQMMKKIGTAARIEIEKFLGAKVFLQLFVKVSAGWRRSPQFVQGLDWRKQLEDLTGQTLAQDWDKGKKG